MIELVCEFNGMPRVHCPALIMPLTQGELDALPHADRRAATRERDVNVQSAADANKEWRKLELKAQVFIDKYLGSW